MRRYYRLRSNNKIRGVSDRFWHIRMWLLDMVGLRYYISGEPVSEEMGSTAAVQPERLGLEPCSHAGPRDQ